MRAVRIDEPGELRVVELPEPMPASDEVVVTIGYAGICGSDVDLLTGARPVDFVRYPVVPGHEWSGTVTAVGAGGDQTLLGRKVVGEGFVPCAGCRMCGQGDRVLCETRYDEIGFTRSGAWAEQLAVPAASLHLLADDADLRSAAGLEPVACSAEAVALAEVTAGDRVAVVGGGTIGALAVQLLLDRRPDELVIVEPVERRAELARRCGASGALTPEQAERCAGRFDVVIEAAGAVSSAATSVRLAKRGGRVVLAGIPDAAAMVSVADVVTKRVTVRTVFGASSKAWADAVAAFDAGLLDPQILVTHEVALECARDAIDLVSGRSLEVSKVLLCP
jgi:2-desacetyl-2-hydroxyethyl bacteriochlorophyllide A dehydrogenase